MMKSYANFAAWKRDQSKGNQPLIQKLRKLVNDLDLPLNESVKWGNGVWIKGELPICYIYGFEGGVQLGFFAGSMVADPKKRLEGKGKYVRFFTVKSKDDIDAKYFATLVKRAAKIKYR